MNAAPTIADADVAVRPAVDSDRGFLRTLADDTRRAEFAALELPPAALDQFLELQFEGHPARSSPWG
jgi:hypothetical protein